MQSNNNYLPVSVQPGIEDQDSIRAAAATASRHFRVPEHMDSLVEEEVEEVETSASMTVSGDVAPAVVPPEPRGSPTSSIIIPEEPLNTTRTHPDGGTLPVITNTRPTLTRPVSSGTSITLADPPTQEIEVDDVSLRLILLTYDRPGNKHK